MEAVVESYGSVFLPFKKKKEKKKNRKLKKSRKPKMKRQSINE